MWFEERDRLKHEVMATRRAILRAMEEERGARVIPLIHRREPWAQAEGDGDHITIEDTEFVLMRIRETPKDIPIDVIVHTPGGLALAAEMIAMSLHYHPAKVTVMVPFYAMSGGTLIVLAADEILMEPYSVLGPVDPQIAGFPSGSLIRIVSRKSLEMIQDQTIILSDIAKMAVENMKGFVKWLLRDRMEEDRAEQVAEFLTGGYLAHDTPITLQVAKELGLNVVEGVPSKVYELFTTCEFGLCKRPCFADYGMR